LALVLAAGCGDSNGGGGDFVRATAIVFTGAAENPSFQGFPPDLTGFTFVVTYSDGSTRQITDVRELEIFPPVVVGWVNPVTEAWVPHRHFEIRHHAAVAASTLVIPEALMRGLARDDLAVSEHNENFLSAQGFHVVGVARMQDTYYVDEQPNFARLDGEAHFWIPGTDVDDQDRPQLPQRVVRDFYLADAYAWGGLEGVIQPRYDGTPRTATGTGFKFITFGRNPWFEPGRTVGTQRQVGIDMDSANIPGAHYTVNNPNFFPLRRTIPGGANYDGLIPDPGLTFTAPLREVYHVHGIEFAQAPSFGSVFYWEPHLWARTPLTPNDDSATWVTRALQQGVSFRVTYSNGTVRTHSLQFLLDAPDVWWNENENPDHALAEAETHLARPFRVLGLIRDSFPATVLPSGDPNARELARDPAGWGVNGAGAQEITFVYRGWPVSAPVTVWNNLVSLTVRSADGNAIVMNMETGFQDNDNIYAGPAANAQGFASRIIVEALFSELRDPTSTYTLTLTYNHAMSRLFSAGVTTGGGEPAIDPALASISDQSSLFGTGNAPLTAANIGRQFFMDFGIVATQTCLWGGTHGAMVNPAGPGHVWPPFGQAIDPENNGTSQVVTIWYATPVIGESAYGLIGTGWVEAVEGAEPGEAGTGWHLFGTRPVDTVEFDPSNGWLRSRLGDPRMATINVNWINIPQVAP